ncbi:MAG TPA: TRAP transporter small permease [Alphaproteobacteria bacterium]|nr:TRAP transporter small permease [Alphaproteobacteria bacterium]
MTMRLRAAWKSIEENAAQGFLAGTCLMVFVAAASRTLGEPVTWAIDIAQFMFIWCCMLGANQAMRRSEHIVIDILIARFPPGLRRMLDVAWSLLMLGFLAIIVVVGTQLTLLNLERTIGDTDISYGWVTGAVPFGGVLLFVTTLVQFIDRIRRGSLGGFAHGGGELV